MTSEASLGLIPRSSAAGSFIGCTGYVAREIWEEENTNLEKYYNKVDADLRETFAKLNSKMDNNALIDNVLKFIKLIRR